MENDIYTDEELLREMKRLEKELEAYQIIANGFRSLALMPEKAGFKSIYYNIQADDYRAMEQSCVQSIRILHKIKSERGL